MRALDLTPTRVESNLHTRRQQTDHFRDQNRFEFSPSQEFIFRPAAVDGYLQTFKIDRQTVLI